MGAPDYSDSIGPEYYDRNPDTDHLIGGSSAAGANSLAGTLKGSYTCPAGKLAWLEHADLRIVNNSSTAVAARSYAYLDVTPSGGVVKTLLETWMMPGGGWEQAERSLNGRMLLKPGDKVELYVASDDATVGTSKILSATAKIVEFDPGVSA